MRFLRWLGGIRPTDRLLVTICREQQNLLKAAASRIVDLEDEREMLQRATLEQVRLSLHISSAFRISQEAPEEDVREDLDNIIRDLSDQVAQLEEHLV